jgi:hypothetical protein
MATLTKGHTFASGDTVTATKLNDLVDDATATFATADDTDDSTLEVSGNKFRVKDAGVTNAKLATGIDASKITTGEMSGSRLVDDSVTDAKLSLAANAGEVKKALNADNAPPIYACRAWVNFDGTVADNLAGTYTRAGTDVTISATGHGLIVGNVVELDFTGGSPTAAVDGDYTVTQVDDANTFDVTTSASGSSSGGTVSLLRRLIRGAGNVSSVSRISTGKYAVNFATAMPDANYAAVGSSGAAAASAESTNVGDKTTTSCIVYTQTSSGPSAVDREEVSVAIFR